MHGDEVASLPRLHALEALCGHCPLQFIKRQQKKGALLMAAVIFARDSLGPLFDLANVQLRWQGVESTYNLVSCFLLASTSSCSYTLLLQSWGALQPSAGFIIVDTQDIAHFGDLEFWTM
ncbi:hypothetical protein CMV_019101 [Castanea mollissima]|uniref:Uncharacterized protein n=1 Tax=Castanea mollissima TaxID=60419 RepID=A0A8J4QKY7_9ROSI|nr:hypothetical protein CMV_019101 [Castanea mollissima]